MNRTKIEWVRNPDGTQGYTWNPITGCLNHIDGMCKGGGFPCYAYKLAHGRLKERYLANTNVAYQGSFHDLAASPILLDPFYPRFWPERLNELLDTYRNGGRIPRGVFSCDMSDLFGIDVPEIWTRNILEAIDQCQDWRFYLLTKQPQNLPKWSPFPDNCWVGVTATKWLQMSDAIGYLSTTEAKVKFISFEPLLERMELDMMQKMLLPMAAHWLIIGAQTKPYKPPKIEWVQEIVGAADKAGIAVFLKDNLSPLLESELDNKFLIKDMPYLKFHRWGKNKFDVETQILRQEFPK